MQAVNLLIDGTIKATGLILQQHGVAAPSKMDNADLTLLAKAIKAVLTENLEAVLKEWEEGARANVGEAWLREMINAQCNDLALKALQRAGMLTDEAIEQ